MVVWGLGFSERERITMEILSAETEDPEYHWLNASVQVNVGGFSGLVSISILESDLTRFRDSLAVVHQNLKGIAEFNTLEDQLYIRLEVDMLGHVIVNGYLKDEASFGNKLIFEMTLDQTIFQQTISDINAALDSIVMKQI